MGHHLAWAVVLASAFFAASEVASQSNANPTIPPHLLECYRNPEIYARERRYPSDLRTFLDLVRRIERSPSGQQMSARTLSMALLYHLRLDGIQPTPNVRQTADVTPFAPAGNNYYKYRLMLLKLLPRPNRPSNFQFFNESLTEKEMCNLHFMLSYSVDPYRREDEDCGKIKIEDYSEARHDPYDSYYGRRHGYYGRSHSVRHRRRIASERAKRLTHSEHGKHTSEGLERHRQREEGGARAVEASDSKSAVSRRTRNARPHGDDHKKHADVETIPANALEALTGSQERAKKGEFTLGHDVLLGPGYDHALRGGYGRHAAKSYDGSAMKRTAMNYGDGSRILLPGHDRSECPVENGVIKTDFGSVTIGAVVGGIAAGFNYQLIPLSEFNADARGIPVTERVNNVWAATLAGNAADLILSLGYVEDLKRAVGLKGGWNSTARPNWYLLSGATPNHLTDVELRGALDGLWLGLKIREWAKDMRDVRLSEILSMYYSEDGSCFDPKVRASARGEEFPGYAPSREFATQVNLFSIAMKNQRANTVTYSDFTNAVGITVDSINAYVPQLSPMSRSLSVGPNSLLPKIDPHVNLAVVIDPQWDAVALESYIAYLIRGELGATPGQSNLTIICPTQINGTYPIEDGVDFLNKFEEIYLTCKDSPQAFNYDVMYEQIIRHFSRVMDMENDVRRMMTQSNIALFVISDTQRPPDADSVRDNLRRTADYVPGIAVLVATNGAREKFRDLVATPERDIFSLPEFTENIPRDTKLLVDRMSRVPQRLSNPACGSKLESRVYFEGDAEALEDIRVARHVVYRLDPYYFYRSGDVKLQVTTKSGQSLKVCHGRDVSLLPPYTTRSLAPSTYSGAGDTEDVDGLCKEGNDVVFDFSDLCAGVGSAAECAPLFAYVQAPLLPDFRVTCVNCRFSTNVEYKIKMGGLTCNASAKTVAVSLSLLLVNWFVASATSF